MSAQLQPYPERPARPEFALDSTKIVGCIDPDRPDLTLRGIGGAIAREFETLIRDRMDELSLDWEDEYPRLSVSLDQGDFRRAFSELQDSVIFGQVFDGYPEGLRSHLATLGEFLRGAGAASPNRDMDALFDQLEACLPGLGMFNDDLQGFAVTLLLLDDVDFEGTLTGLVRASFSEYLDAQLPQEVWSAGYADVLLDFDHLVLDPDLRTHLHRSDRRQLHLIGAEQHVHGDALPIGHWLPGVFGLRAMPVRAEAEDEERPPFGPVRLTDHHCIARFVWGRWYCLGDARQYETQLQVPAEPPRRRTEQAAAAASVSPAEEQPYEEDEIDQAIREAFETRERRTAAESVQAGVQLWIPVIAAMLETDSGLQVRMTPIAQFDAVRGVKRDALFYELAALQPFVFEVFKQWSEETLFGFGPGEFYALRFDDVWTSRRFGVATEGGPSAIARMLLHDWEQAE